MLLSGGSSGGLRISVLFYADLPMASELFKFYFIYWGHVGGKTR